MSTVVGVGPVRKEVAHVGGTLSGLAMGDPVHGSVAGVSAAVVVVELSVKGKWASQCDERMEARRAFLRWRRKSEGARLTQDSMASSRWVLPSLATALAQALSLAPSVDTKSEGGRGGQAREGTRRAISMRSHLVPPAVPRECYR